MSSLGARVNWRSVAKRSSLNPLAKEFNPTAKPPVVRMLFS